jgi:hypothetical protein
MFKTADGQLFDKIGDAVAHEQSVFLKAGLLPLFSRLLDAADKTDAIVGGEPVSLDERMVSVLSADRDLASEFQKLFAKLQLQPAAPVSRRRARTAAKKAAKQAPAQDSAAPVEPKSPEEPKPEASPDLPPFAPTVEPTPTAEHMGAIDSLAAGGPIEIPTFDEQAPPPPVQ